MLFSDHRSRILARGARCCVKPETHGARELATGMEVGAKRWLIVRRWCGGRRRTQEWSWATHHHYDQKSHRCIMKNQVFPTTPRVLAHPNNSFGDPKTNFFNHQKSSADVEKHTHTLHYGVSVWSGLGAMSSCLVWQSTCATHGMDVPPNHQITHIQHTERRLS